MAASLRFHVTKHAALRFMERGVSLESAKDVVKYSKQVEKLQSGHNGGTLKRFRKTADGKTLVVVAEVKDKDCWIATAYYDEN